MKEKTLREHLSAAGKASAAKLTPQQRTDRAKKAVAAREAKRQKPFFQADHFHCWQQGKAPACGLPIAAHEACCLCAIKKRRENHRRTKHEPELTGEDWRLGGWRYRTRKTD